MGTRVVKVLHILFCQTPRMAFAQNQEVIEEFTPHTAHEALTDRIGFRRIGWCVDECDPRSLHGMVEQRTVLVVIIADQKPWTVAKGRCLSNLLGYPGIIGGASHIDMNHAPGAMLDDEKEKDRSEEQVIGLHKIAGPDF